MASNKAGNLTATFFLEILDCQYGDYLLPYVFGSEKGKLDILQDGQIITSTFVDKSKEHGICIPKGTFSYSFNCTSSAVKPYRCSFQIEDEHFNYYLSLYALRYIPVSGTFETKATQKPTIHMRSLIAAYSGQDIREYIEVVGIHANLTISPALPDSITIDQQRSAIIGTIATSGLSVYTITAANEIGEDSFVVTFGIDTCPSNYELVVFRRFGGTAFDSIQFINPSGEMLFDNDFSYGNPTYNFCLTPGQYTFNFAYTLQGGTGWDETNPLQIYFDGVLVSNFLLESNITSETRHFNYLYPIQKESSFHTSFEHADRWTSSKFKESQWSEKKAGQWGTYPQGHTSMYLRRSFNIPSLKEYSIMHMNLLSSENLTVYLNERVLFTSGPLPTLTQFSFSLEEFEKGNNIIAIELKQFNSSSIDPITFDMNLLMITSECLLRSINGTATDNQPNPTSYYPVSDAFISDSKKYWQINSYPIYGRYTFAHNSKHIMNSVMISKPGIDTPVKFSIQAVNDDNSVVTLASIESRTFFSYGEYKYIHFDNTKAYSAYQILFEETMKNSTMTVHDIHFMACYPNMCNKKWGIPKSTYTTTFYKSCPAFKIGTKQVRCRNVDNQATWVDDLSACIPRNPQKGISFVDWSVRLYNITMGSQKDIIQAMTSLIMKNLRVQEEEIGYVLIRDVSTIDISIVQIDIRFTFELEIGDYILKHVKAMIPRFNELVKKYFGSISSSVSGEILDKPTLHTPVNIALIVTIVVIVILGIILGIYFKVRLSKNPDGSQPKRLRKTLKKRKEEDTSLLSNAV